MTVLQATRSKASSDVTRSGALFLLELSGGRIHSMNPDGSDHRIIVTDCEMPDGIAIDAGAGHIYWTNMGSSPDVNDGSIERADFSNRSDIEVFFDHSTYLTRGCPELRCREAIAITAHAARRPARAPTLFAVRSVRYEKFVQIWQHLLTPLRPLV